MWPGDLKVLSDRLDNLSTAKGFPAGSRPYIYMEVIDQGTPPARVTTSNQKSKMFYRFNKVESQLRPTSISTSVA
jgi:hypothetical protein